MTSNHFHIRTFIPLSLVVDSELCFQLKVIGGRNALFVYVVFTTIEIFINLYIFYN